MTAVASPLPPGPLERRIAPLRASLAVYRDPFRAYTDASRRYGDPFTLPTLRGKLVVTGDPEGARDVFTADPSHFEVWAADAFVPVLGASSLIVASGAPHVRLRKLLAPTFSGSRMRLVGPIMREITMRAIDGWPRGRAFSMHACMQAVALEVTLRAVFSIADDVEVEAFRAAVLDMLVAAHPALLFFDVAFQGALFDRVRRNLGPWARARRAVERVDALIFEQIARRRREGVVRDDMLGAMMSARQGGDRGMSDAELRDQLITMLIAGHETTASALAWALYRIHRHPEVAARLARELAALGADPAPDALAAQPYLDAVCAETLRLHPVVTEASRLLRKPLVVRGYEIPAGVSVAASIALIHAREDIYPEPERFRPERFLERKFGIFEFLPFGGGARRCIGGAFSMYEMKIVIGTIASRAGGRLRLAEPGPIGTVRRGGVTMGPEGGVPMTFEGRH